MRHLPQHPAVANPLYRAATVSDTHNLPIASQAEYCKAIAEIETILDDPAGKCLELWDIGAEIIPELEYYTRMVRQVRLAASSQDTIFLDERARGTALKRAQAALQVIRALKADYAYGFRSPSASVLQGTPQGSRRFNGPRATDPTCHA